MSEEQELIEQEIVEDVESGEMLENTDDSSEDGELSISFGDETPEPTEEDKEAEVAPQWVKDLRKRDRENSKQLKALQLENERLKQPVIQQASQLEAEPDPLDFDVWEDEGKRKYAAALMNWQKQKQELDAVQGEQQKAHEAQRTRYAANIQALGVSDYQDAENRVVATLDNVKQSLLLEVLDNAPQFVYALGKDQARLEELAKIKSPAKFIEAIVELRGKLKMSRTNSDKPKPIDHKLTGGASTAGGDAALNKIYAAAQKSGDYSAYHAAKRNTK